MTLPSPAEQLASRKRLNALFRTPKHEPEVRRKAVKRPFIENPNAPRCLWPRVRDWLDLSSEPEDRIPVIHVKTIREVVGLHYEVSQVDLLSDRRTHKVVLPRQVAMYLAKTLTLKSLPEIGRRFGGRDHTTVLHAVRKITALREQDPVVASDLQRLTDQIKEWSGA